MRRGTAPAVRDRGRRLRATRRACAFGSTLLGSRAVAGTFDRGAARQAPTRGGMTMRDALRRIRARSRAHRDASRASRTTCSRTSSCTSSRGPVLESERAAGRRGHRDQWRQPLQGRGHRHGGPCRAPCRWACAATRSPPPRECVLAVERIASGMPEVVGTVGRIDAHPGAMNVIPGKVRVFARRARADATTQRHAAVARDARGVRRRSPRGATSELALAPVWEARTAPCAPAHAGADRRRDRCRRRAGASPAVGRRSRRHGADRHRADRHAVRPLRRRHQPQPGRSDHAGRRRPPARACSRGSSSPSTPPYAA